MLRDRTEAGKQLANVLQQYKNVPDTVVVALPRGGVIVGFEIAQALRLPLTVIVVRKIGAPSNPEYAIGALTEEGESILDEQYRHDIDENWLREKIKDEKIEIARRLKMYREGKPLSLNGQMVILVDDGIAMGYTMEAAIRSAKLKNAQRIIVAVPHGARDAVERIRSQADEMVVLTVPEIYSAVGAQYAEFSQISDAEVLELLERSKARHS